MLDCKDVNKQFYQSFVSSKTREVIEAALFDQHYLFNQSKNIINLNIEMLN
jgi:hypothetical protein